MALGFKEIASLLKKAIVRTQTRCSFGIGESPVGEFEEEGCHSVE